MRGVLLDLDMVGRDSGECDEKCQLGLRWEDPRAEGSSNPGLYSTPPANHLTELAEGYVEHMEEERKEKGDRRKIKYPSKRVKYDLIVLRNHQKADKIAGKASCCEKVECPVRDLRFRYVAKRTCLDNVQKK